VARNWFRISCFEFRIWLLSFLLLATLVLVGYSQEIVRLSQNVPGDSKPILLYADEISTWMEGHQRVLLLKGMVLVEHGLIQGRMQGAVAWVDQERTRRTGIMHLDLYAEGDVHLEGDVEARTGPRAFIDLNTRGQLKLRSHEGKVIQQPRQDDPIYLRAVAQRSALAPPAAPVIQRTSAQSPAPGSPINPGPTPAQPTQMPPNSPYVIPSIDSTRPPTTPDPGPPSLGAPVTPNVPAPSGPQTAPAAPVPGPPANPVPRPPPRTTSQAPQRQIRIVPRYSQPWNESPYIYPNGEQAILVTGGIILTVENPDPKVEILDIEADRLVVWTRGNLQQFSQEVKSPEGKSTRDAEFYMSGNVIIRMKMTPVPRPPGAKPVAEPPVLRADEVYYDVSRNVAVARQADLEFRQPGLPDPIHMLSEELIQVSPKHYQSLGTELSSSRLPSDPEVKIYLVQATLDEKQVPKKTLFGRQVYNHVTGEPEVETQLLFRGNNMFLKVEDIPIFYLPVVQGDARDPLGPLENIQLNYNRIFGFQTSLTLNLYDLFGIDPRPGTRWRGDVDYLTARGPALGTQYEYGGGELFGLAGHYNGLVKAWGIYDNGTDILGGGRGPNDNHPLWRGRFLWRDNWSFLDDFTLQFQVSALSDPNFLEQYYKNEFDNDINQETFIYFKQQRNNWAWTLLADDRIRYWVTETSWLPRADGYLLGQSFFDLLTYNVHGSAAYAKLMPTGFPPPSFTPTDAATNTGRFDLWQELSLPFSLGFLRIVPYGVLDLTDYTNDLDGNNIGRVYAAGGIRASMPLSRIYPDVHSEFLNLNGINHKIVLSANYYIAHSDVHFNQLPQLDQLNDNATDQALRDLHPVQPALNPNYGLFLITSPMFNPQVYAIQRLVDNRIDTLDTIEVLQLDLRQRWQTKRGYPGMEHIVDWMTLDLSASYFPKANRDDFGEPFSFLQYDWIWNVGDRTALVSTGWFDTETNGARVFTLGAFLNRPDRTNLYLGYRNIFPVNSQAGVAAVTYVFSPKYALTLSTFYDFGTQVQANSLVLTRMGKDLQANLGFSYNSTLNTFGFQFELLPNAVAATQRVAGMPGFGSGAIGR
jgi:hypothetical protein